MMNQNLFDRKHDKIQDYSVSSCNNWSFTFKLLIIFANFKKFVFLRVKLQSLHDEPKLFDGKHDKLQRLMVL
jgi:hypothetical protein